MSDVQEKESPVSRYLSSVGEPWLGIYCIVAAFGTYFCMYAFRKPFTAGTFEDLTFAGVAFKTVLIASQVSGYTISKFIGIKVISEMPAHLRAVSIIVLIGIAELALLGFGLVPAPWNMIMLFINGLPLGMVFGLVLAYLEGRRNTEALSAGLCASFIVSSGVVKSVGRWLILDFGFSDFWMPFYTGLIFLPALLFFVWMLNQIPPPTHIDRQLRRERKPMTAGDRWHFLQKHGVGLGMLITVFILLTVVRSIRDDFGVEIWQKLLPGEKEEPAIYSKTETLIAFAVVIVNGLAINIRSNRAALLGSLGLLAAGFLLTLGAIAGYGMGILPPFPFMVLVGLGLYVPYVAYHTTIFERLIASVQESANIGYLMYLADAVGYLGYVAVMVFKNRGSGDLNMLTLFNSVTLSVGIFSLVLTAVMLAYYARRLPRRSFDVTDELKENADIDSVSSGESILGEGKL